MMSAMLRRTFLQSATSSIAGLTLAGRSSAVSAGVDWEVGCFNRPWTKWSFDEALKEIRRRIRRWGLQNRTDKALDDLARMFDTYIRGWIGYYGHFYKSALLTSLRRIDFHLVKWAQRKFKSLRHRPKRARDWLNRVIRTSPGLFAHWKLLYASGRTLGAV